MSTEVDNKVVSIKFDNASFQAKMSETIASLDKLRKSLDMQGATKGMSELAGASKSFNMEPVSTSIDTISAKFAALTGIGVAALATITTKAVEAGINIAKSFSFGPAVQGFSEFEDKMGAIQTIMAGSGASLEEVNTQLGELNAYSDRTIYSFNDMTQSIGKFTNAGVDLDKSVNAIQGIANVAAISGANAQQASAAMYNFGQAMSSGSVKLLDWKSIEIAGMATVEFKQQLIDSAVAAGTLTKAADGYRTAAGNTVTTTKGFNESLSDAWLTADALTTTLNRYSDTTTDVGARATAAAQDVKTFSQMIGTMKESVGSGWAQTFEHVLGNFEEGKTLWTGIMTGFNATIGASASLRNKELAAWKRFGSGGRNVLIQGVKDAVSGIASIFKPVQEAFREIFPRTMAADLIRMTRAFADFAKGIKITGGTADKIKQAFLGVFSILDIGWEIIKGVTRVFFALAGAIWTIFSPLLQLLSGTGSLIKGFHDVAVEGKGIETFFNGFVTAIKSVGGAIAGVIGGVVDFINELGLFQAIGSGLSRTIEILKSAAGAIREFFSSLSFGGGDKGSKAAEDGAKKLEDTASFAERLLDALKNIFRQIKETFAGIGGLFGDAFKGLGGALSDALGSGNINQVLDVIKVGLLGGILKVLHDFFTKGFKIDFGFDVIKGKIIEILDGITGTLKNMQQLIKAETIKQIAIAMAILTVSIIALSLVDAAKLGKALAAITVGFAQMAGVLVVLNKTTEEVDTRKILAMGAAMVLIAAAMAILSLAILVLGHMDLDQLAKGVGAVSVAMLVMSEAVFRMGDNLEDAIKGGIAVMLMAVALIFLARAVGKFAEMDPWKMATGMAAASVGMALLFGAIRLLPDDLQKDGIGLLILSLALASLAKVVEIFADMPWQTLAKGFGVIVVGLTLIGDALWAFPDDMPEKAASILILSASLVIMGKAMEMVGSIPFGELVKGIGGLIVMLGALVIAVLMMEETEAGVAALLLAAAGLLILGQVIKTVGAMPIDQILTGIAGIAALLVVMAAASLMAPNMLILGQALLLIGAGFALMGIGMAAAGKGFELMAKFGGAGMKHIVEMLQEVIRQVPQFISAFIEGMIQGFLDVANQAPQLIDAIVNVLNTVLDAIIEVIPKAQEALNLLISAAIDTFIEAIPQFIAAGWAMITGYLGGIRDNIGEIVTIVGEIITGFLDAMTVQLPQIVGSLVELMAALFTSVAEGLGRLMPTLMFGLGISFLEGFWEGIQEQAGRLGEIVTDIINGVLDFFRDLLGIKSPSTVMAEIGGFLIEGFINGIKAMFGLLKQLFIDLPLMIFEAIGDVLMWLWDKGGDLISGFLNGINAAIHLITEFLVGLPAQIVGWLGDALGWLWDKGGDLIQGFLNGIHDAIHMVVDWFIALPGKILGWIGNIARTLFTKGKDLITGFWDGLVDIMDDVQDWLGKIPGKAIGWIGNVLQTLHQKGADLIQGIWNGLVATIHIVSTWLGDLPGKVVGWAGNMLTALEDAGGDLIRGLWNGINDMKDWVLDKVSGFAGSIIDGVKGFFGVNSPSLVFMDIGHSLGEGLGMGINDMTAYAVNEATAMGDAVVAGWEKANVALVAAMSGIDQFSPTITPVLDLTEIRKSAKDVDGMLSTSSIDAELSVSNARRISAATSVRPDESEPTGGPESVTNNYNQTINAPTALSTVDIYRQSKSLFAVKKEELNI